MKFSKEEFLNFECCIFDLDDTLYSEKYYLFSAYKVIGKFVYSKYDLNEDLVVNYLISEFKKKGRNKLFNYLISEFKLEESDLKIFLEILRNHKMNNKLFLFNEMEKLLSYLNYHGIPIFLLTNGNVEQQKNKIDQINWNGIKFKEFIFANLLIPKPSPESLKYIINKYNFSSKNMIFIGDSIIDKQCAKYANVPFVNVKQLLVN